MEAEDAAEAALGLGDEEGRGVGLRGRRFVGEQGREVVVEGEDGFVVGIADATGAGVGGAEVAGGVVGDCGSGGGGGGFSLPGALGALGGDEDPLAEERVVATVGDEVEWCGGHDGSLELKMRRVPV
jgi:hypothetical protein